MTRDERIESNLRLVHACARRFIGRGIEYDDLYSAGCLGLVKAVDKYDPGLGYRFSTYAVPVILGELKQLFRSEGSVKLSRSLKELSLKARRTADAYRRDTGKDITITSLAEQLGVDAYRAQEALNASRAVLSLSGNEEEGGVDIPVPSPEEALTDRLSLNEVIATLSEDERALITLRYFYHKTQQQTAEQLGTTQVQISRKEKRILIKMKMMLV